MRKTCILVVGLLVYSLTAFAGEYLMNDTGGTVTGLRVVFSEPVSLTGFGDVLMTVEPSGEATSFVFSGGSLEAWGGHWLSWAPTTARIMSYEWLTSPTATAAVYADDVAVVSHRRESVFELRLPSDEGGEKLGTVTCTVSMEQIPFVAWYSVEFDNGNTKCTWYDSAQSKALATGRDVCFVASSNEDLFSVTRKCPPDC